MTGLSVGSSFILSQERKHTHTGISYSSLSLLDLVQRCHLHWQSSGMGYLFEGYLIIHLFIDQAKQVSVTLFTWKEKTSFPPVPASQYIFTNPRELFDLILAIHQFSSAIITGPCTAPQRAGRRACRIRFHGKKILFTSQVSVYTSEKKRLRSAW